MNENKQLCPNCKTGADAMKLDPCEAYVSVFGMS